MKQNLIKKEGALNLLERVLIVHLSHTRVLSHSPVSSAIYSAFSGVYALYRCD